jgi:hypothetical protein
LHRAIDEGAIAGKQLTAAIGALFNIATRHMELAFLDTAVTARVVIRTPVVRLFAIPHSGELFVS